LTNHDTLNVTASLEPEKLFSVNRMISSQGRRGHEQTAVTPEERKLLERWDRLPPKIRLHLSGLIDASLGEEPFLPLAPPRKKKSSKRR
jgi:hypothetical protein